MKMEPTGRENSNTTNRATILLLLATKVLLIQPLSMLVDLSGEIITYN